VLVVGRNAILAVLVAGVGAVGAAAATSDPRLELNVAFGRQLVHATPSSSCLSGRQGGRGRDGRCSDAKYPLRTAGRLVLAPRKQLRMRTGAPASEVEVRLLAEGYASDPPVFERTAVRQARDPQRFRLSLPRRLPCAAIADVVVRYPGGVVSFWAAVKTPRCVRVEPQDEEEADDSRSGRRGRDQRTRG
jgi:hypothetical protein